MDNGYFATEPAGVLLLPRWPVVAEKSDFVKLLLFRQRFDWAKLLLGRGWAGQGGENLFALLFRQR
jgi:hypothetical protein